MPLPSHTSVTISLFIHTYRSIDHLIFVLLNIECFGLVCCEHPIQDALGPYLLTGTPELLFDYSSINYAGGRWNYLCVYFYCVRFFRFWDLNPRPWFSHIRHMWLKGITTKPDRRCSGCDEEHTKIVNI